MGKIVTLLVAAVLLSGYSWGRKDKDEIKKPEPSRYDYVSMEREDAGMAEVPAAVEEPYRESSPYRSERFTQAEKAERAASPQRLSNISSKQAETLASVTKAIGRNPEAFKAAVRAAQAIAKARQQG